MGPQQSVAHLAGAVPSQRPRPFVQTLKQSCCCCKFAFQSANWNQRRRCQLKSPLCCFRRASSYPTQGGYFSAKRNISVEGSFSAVIIDSLTVSVRFRSYLGYGLMAGRAEVLAWEETRAANPCVPSDHTGVYVYGGKEHTLVAAPSGASFDACAKVVLQVLQHDKDCGAPKVGPSPLLVMMHLSHGKWNPPPASPFSPSRSTPLSLPPFRKFSFY